MKDVKLSLNKEIVAELNSSDMKSVIGGIIDPNETIANCTVLSEVAGCNPHTDNCIPISSDCQITNNGCVSVFICY